MPPLSDRRSEFLNETYDVHDTIKYKRGGGCFVTYKKAFCIGIIVVLLMIAIAFFAHCFLPSRKSMQSCDQELQNELTRDIHNLQKDDMTRKPNKKFPTITPSYYRLKIRTFLADESDMNFTFSGKVSIVFQTNYNGVNKIRIHAKNLRINESFIDVTTVSSQGTEIDFKAEPLVALSQVAESNISSVNESVDNSSVPSSSDANSSLSETNTATELPVSTETVNQSMSDQQEVTTIASNDDLEVTTLQVNSTDDEALNNTSNVVNTHRNLDNHSTNKKIQVNTLSPIPVINLDYDQEEEQYVIYLKKSLTAGQNYTLRILFSGVLDETFDGFFTTNFEDNDSIQFLAATNFQNKSARKVFPCFDEMDLKAKFEISIGRRENLKSLSNMKLKQSEPIKNTPGWMWDHYEISPPMAPHSVTFMVANFPQAESAAENIPLRIWSRSSLSSQIEYARKVLKDLILYYKSIFGTAYPIEKLDIVSIPHLPNTVMANWGLVFMPEIAVASISSNNYIPQQLFVLNQVARRVVQQWFGNLVSYKDWQDAWINEGIVTYWVDKGITHIEPSLENLNHEMITGLEPYFSAQSSLASIENMADPIQTIRTFDNDYNSKGALLIQMLENIISEPIFMKGINQFLNYKQNHTTNVEKLWSLLENLLKEQESNGTIHSLPSSIKLTEFVQHWLQKDGVPVLTIKRDYTSGDVILSQTKFAINNKTNNKPWYIPVCTSILTDPNATTWEKNDRITWFVDKSSKMMTINSPNSLLVFNQKIRELFPVNYDETNWNLLINEMNRSVDPYTQILSINDAFNLAELGLLSYSVPLSLSTRLSIETNEGPVLAFLSKIHTLDAHLSETAVYGMFQNYVLKIILPIVNNIKESKSHMKQLFEYKLDSVLCYYEYSGCISEAKKNYEQYSQDLEENKIPTDIRFSELCTIIRTGTKNEWNLLWNKSKVLKDSPSQYYKVLSALGCSRDSWLLKRYLDLSVNTTAVPLYDMLIIWNSFTSATASYVQFSYLQENWLDIYKKFNQNELVIAKMLYSSLKYLRTQKQLNELYLFYLENRNDLRRYSSLILKSLEVIQLKKTWKTKYYENIKQWLQNFIGNDI